MRATVVIYLLDRKDLKSRVNRPEDMRTMSSGSSGHSVTVPEPLSSTLFLTKRIVAYI